MIEPIRSLLFTVALCVAYALVAGVLAFLGLVGLAREGIGSATSAWRGALPVLRTPAGDQERDDWTGARRATDLRN
ncbi:MAG TPA: hypothetical protein VET90_09295 [Candidatus Binatus sp.]|nr:hypothetical protein [Candidatus Binatus sp.]